MFVLFRDKPDRAEMLNKINLFLAKCIYKSFVILIFTSENKVVPLLMQILK